MTDGVDDGRDESSKTWDKNYFDGESLLDPLADLTPEERRKWEEERARFWDFVAQCPGILDEDERSWLQEARVHDEELIVLKHIWDLREIGAEKLLEPDTRYPSSSSAYGERPGRVEPEISPAPIIPAWLADTALGRLLGEWPPMGREALPDALKDAALEDLGLSVRAYKALRRARVTTLGQLIGLSEGEILRIRNMGRRSFLEVKARVIVAALEAFDPYPPRT